MFGFIPGCQGAMQQGQGGIQTFAGTGKNITVPNYTNAKGNSMGDAITRALNKIENALNSDTSGCATWLQGSIGSGTDLIKALLNGGDYGYGDFYNGSTQNYTTGAFSGLLNPDGTSTGSTGAFTINAAGSFYNSMAPGGTLSAGGYQGGTIQAQAMILIHELAHMLGVPKFNQNDNGNQGLVDQNNQQVQKNCGSLIKSLQ